MTGNSAYLYEKTGTTNNNFGFRLGYGLTERFDLKLRYEKMAFTRHFDGRLRTAQYFSITPKFAVIPGHFSVFIPIGRYYANYESDNSKYSQRIGSVSPYLMYSMTSKNQKFDLSAHVKSDFIYEFDTDAESNLYLGAGLGVGFSKDLRKWAIRPEVGISSDGSGTYWNYGIGLQFILPTRRK